MRVISLRPLREFWDLHPDARDPLRLWYRTAVKALWRNLHDFWRTYANANADAVRNEAGETLTVFNIGGNKYRLIARIRYDRALVNVRHVLTHDEYDRGRWKE